MITSLSRAIWRKSQPSIAACKLETVRRSTGPLQSQVVFRCINFWRHTFSPACSRLSRSQYFHFRENRICEGNYKGRDKFVRLSFFFFSNRVSLRDEFFFFQTSCNFVFFVYKNREFIVLMRKRKLKEPKEGRILLREWKKCFFFFFKSRRLVFLNDSSDNFNFSIRKFIVNFSSPNFIFYKKKK